MHGVSTRSVGDLDKALGSGTGISRSEVFRSCADLDEQLDAFWTRPLDHIRLPNLFLDATYVKAARVDHRNASQAIVFAAGAAQDGSREVAGVMAGDSETEVFWAQFLRHLHERGLCGVRLVISDSTAAWSKRSARWPGPHGSFRSAAGGLAGLARCRP